MLGKSQAKLLLRGTHSIQATRGFKPPSEHKPQIEGSDFPPNFSRLELSSRDFKIKFVKMIKKKNNLKYKDPKRKRVELKKCLEIRISSLK